MWRSSPPPHHPGPPRQPNTQGLDLEASITYWSALTAIPASQFGRPHRAVADPSIRHAKHVHGCVTVGYSCSATHRTVMGLVHALLRGAAIPG
jgi:hypothetical protein